ncbi:MAG: hypothetical protein CMJ58_07325 [Planctomycetaceae bacterium]|nr:hypothetical protein [Planctomycetaceae bacterium]
MEKFVSFDEAVKKLAISNERLTKLRESGKLRAYRDGASWKFRTDEIERLASEGLPDEGPASDISLVGGDDLMAADELPDLAEVKSLDDDLKLADDDLSLEGSGLELDMGDLGDDEAKPADEATADDDIKMSPDDLPSSLDLEMEDTVTADGPPGSDSILLSEEELGEAAAGPPPSTIIGREELEDADLELGSDESGSDVKLAGPSSGESNVLNSGISGSGVLNELEKESGATSAFADLEELELDLNAESSKALAEEEAKETLAGIEPAAGGEASDIQLEDLELDDDEGTDPVPPAVVEAADKSDQEAGGGESNIELATDEDFVLAESGGSDITLDSGDSGINLVSPADSGLALDDIPLDVEGSAILSSLSLDDEGDADISLLGSDISPDAGGASGLAELEAEDDFNLTPMASAADDEGDSSSQVIALDADMEGLGAEEELGADAFAEVDAEAEMGEDFGEESELGVAAYGGSVAAKRESEYGIGSILALGATAMLLMIAGIIMLDMVRNIWGWQEGLTLNSWILDGLLGMFGLRTS